MANLDICSYISVILTNIWKHNLPTAYYKYKGVWEINQTHVQMFPLLYRIVIKQFNSLCLTVEAADLCFFHWVFGISFKKSPFVLDS